VGVIHSVLIASIAKEYFIYNKLIFIYLLYLISLMVYITLVE
jgi:hypothetical protein